MSPETRHEIRKRLRVPILRRLTRPARLGTLRRTEPISSHYGYDRGTPIDRYYIDRFFAANSAAIRGHALEIDKSLYTGRYGVDVAAIDVVDINPANPHATLIADLARADHLPSEQFDCFILPQTLQYLYDVPSALRHIHRILKPGGVLLATAPGISRLDRGQAGHEYWHFTAASCQRLLADTFGEDDVDVQTHGNVLAAIAFLMGMASEELRRDELDTFDPYYPVVITMRATKAGGPGD